MENKVKKRLLIVDDVKSNIMVLYNILKSDYTILVAKSGLEAIERANEYIPDLILLDIIMPEMDGYAVLAALKESDKTQNIPVIFTTGLSEPNDKEKGLSLGAVDYFCKPFDAAIVKQKVQSHIR